MILRVYLFVLCFFAVGCVDSARTRDLDGNTSNETPATTNFSCDASGFASDESVNCVNGVTPEVELTHFIDPYNGSYTRKLTIPKTFQGIGSKNELYIAGLNVATLAGKNLRVRFSFGKDKEPIVLTATTGKGPGATSNTQVDVLIVDFTTSPLRDVSLFYDLFDYNDYEFDGIAGASNAAVQGNRDPGLYCRGLNLEDDPSFTGAACNANNPECLYAYASIKDKGLRKQFVAGGSYFYTIPDQSQISSEVATDYYSHADVNMLGRCLNDFDPNPAIVIDSGGIAPLYKFSDLISFSNWDQTFLIEGLNYQYSGPYREVNRDFWALPKDSDLALFGRYGIFRKSLRPIALGIDEKLRGGAVANLFPRYTRRTVNANVEHLATSSLSLPGELKSVQSLLATDESNWMEGCNARVASWEPATGEGIGSCNVTAKVEILHEDFQLNKLILLLESKQLKLQLVKDAVYNDEGDNILSNSFSSCSSNTECGGESCCFNGRCWDKTIVSSCFDDSQNTGNKNIGESCSSDLQCASLCCDQTVGVCNVHENTSGTNPVTCGKFPGQSCIASDWCSKQIMSECYVVDNGPNGVDPVTGAILGCQLNCYNVERSGDCVTNTCIAPVPRADDSSSWDPNNPNKCANEQDSSAVPPAF